jgi:hypothetical protein
MIDEETNEERIKRYAEQRQEMRLRLKWKLNETYEDDCRIASEIVQRELHQDRT